MEDPPAELAGVADRVSVVLPWGSLLAAVAGPSADVLRRIRGLCQPDAGLTIVLGGDPVRDRAELLRLGLPALDRSTLTDRLATPYAEAGFTLAAVRPLGPDGLARWPSTWARRLAQGRDRLFFELSARAR